MEIERLPVPWTIKSSDDAYWLESADGKRFAYTYFRDRPIVGTDNSGRVTRDTARRIAGNVARLPDLLQALKMVHWRQQDTFK